MTFTKGRAAEHHTLFRRSLQELTKLKRDMYGLNSPGVSIDDVTPPDPDPLARARYSCLYWVDHFENCHDTESAKEDTQEGGLIEEFLTRGFLYWLESISLLDRVSEGIVAMRKLDDIAQVSVQPYSSLIHVSSN
jgi:hypothetical protein